jgi:TPP-dependent pyruvate/acetoin dehydrogenase alpha subunit
MALKELRDQYPWHDTLEMYRKLFLIRRAEEFIVKYYPENEMKCPMHMSMGQEAISVGVCYALNAQDQVFASYRSHAAFLAKTGDVDTFFAELYGKSTGTAKGKSGSMHLAAVNQGFLGSSGIVGTSIPVAVGAAFANKYKQNGLVSCVFFGDGALDEGVFWESFNMACIKKLPVIFVVEDNGYAVNTPVQKRQAFKDITEIANKFECDTWRVRPGCDVELVYEAAFDARSEAANRPQLLYFMCYRYLQHVGIHEDFDEGYRPRSEYEEWLKRDCVAFQRTRLRSLYSDEVVAGIEEEVNTQIESSIEKAKAAPFPNAKDLYSGVFYEDNLL